MTCEQNNIDVVKCFNDYFNISFVYGFCFDFDSGNASTIISSVITSLVCVSVVIVSIVDGNGDLDDINDDFFMGCVRF